MDNSKLENKRSKALAKGDINYFTGRPCIHGHVDTRRAKSGQCRSCVNDYQRERAKQLRLTPENKVYQREYQANYRHTEKGKVAIAKAQQKYVEKMKDAS